MSPSPPTASELRAAFDAPEPLTVGIEEELMLLDPATLDLLPRAAEVVETAADPRVKLEMPAAQLELTLPPARSVPAAIAGLAGFSPRQPRRSGVSRPRASIRSRPRAASSTTPTATG